VYKLPLAIKIDNLTKTFNNQIVLDHLNLQIDKKEIVSLLGPNGAGKSTIIKILATLLKSDDGTASINGYDIVKDYLEVRKIIGITPQELVLYEELTALENLIFFGMMHSHSRKWLKNEAKRILDILGLADRKDKVKNFSGGMKRRLNLAISIIMDIEVLILDEPTAGLDPQSQNQVWDMLKDLKTKGKTIILTTHDMHEAEVLSDRVFIMNNGKIIAKGTPRQLKEMYSNGNILEVIFKNTNQLEDVMKSFQSLTFVKNVIKESNNKLRILFEGNIINLTKMLNQEYFADLAEIVEMNLRQTTLEDVFIHLTGRELK